MAGSGYKPQLDGLRAFCIIFTIFNHIPGTPSFINGSVGVDVFFALSGWLITWLLLEERERDGSIDISAFYIRRVFRIMPLYYAAFLLYSLAAVAMAVVAAKRGDLADLRSAAPYLLTFNGEYRGTAGGNIFGHAWSLGIEEKFYLVWPALMLLVPASSWRLLGATAVCLLAAVLVASADISIARGYAGLGFGAAAAIAVKRNGALRDRLSTGRIAGLAALLLLPPYIYSIAGPVREIGNFGVSAVSALLIASLWMNSDQWTAAFLSLRPLAWVGRLTFAIYLIHVLAANAVEMVFGRLGLKPPNIVLFLLVYALSIVAAWLLHILFEKPLIGVGRRLARASARPAIPASPEISR